jgi:hypothetical protein
MKAATAERPSRATVTPSSVEVPRGGCGVPGCLDAKCSIPYGLCHCGCGEPTVLARQTDRRLNLVKDEPQRYVHRHQLAGAVEKRWAPSEADRAARQRTCAREGCETVFMPTPDQLRRGVGNYCSHSCARRLHPVPDERECARPGCSERFVPDASKAAHGRGLYCSRPCRDADRWRFSRARVPITCANCGEEKIVTSPYYVGRQRFCSRRCWGLYRWRPGGGLETLAKAIEGCSGDIRRKLKLRLAPKPGRRRTHNDEVREWVRNLRDAGRSWSDIENITGVPKDTARHMAGARQKRS